MDKFEISDSHLVSLYKRGNEEAFEQLITRHKSRVFTTIILIVKDNEVAEDLLQDTLIKVVNTIKCGRYNETGRFLPWVMKIAHNLAIDYFRKKKRYPTVLMDNGSTILNKLEYSVNSIEDTQIKKDTKTKLRELIQELPDSQKEVLIMRHYMRMSFQEIAESTDVSINTALGRMRYALINLRKKMKKYKIAYDQNFYPR